MSLRKNVGQIDAADLGLLAQAYPYPNVGINSSPLNASGTIHGVTLPVEHALLVTEIVAIVTTLGAATAVAGQNLAALYQGGVLLGITADQSSIWYSPGSTGVKFMALASGPFRVEPGEVDVAFLGQSSGAKPAFGKANTALANNPDATARRHWTADTSRTTFPATLGTKVTTNAQNYWAGLR